MKSASNFAAGARVVPTLFLWVVCALMLIQPVMGQRGPGSERQLRKALEATLKASPAPNAIWGVYVASLKTGKKLFEHNPDISLVPASNTKLYTTSAALDQLGPEFRYTTTLYTDGQIEDGVLKGNLIVRGSGDPVIGGRFNDDDRTETFRVWADSLRSQGIRRIEGDIVGDDDIFDDVPLGSGWSWDDEPYWYAAEISGLSFNDNNIDFSIESQLPGMPGLVTWEPAQTGYARVTNATVTISDTLGLDEGYYRERGTNEFRLFSAVPAGGTDTESLTVSNPTLFFTQVLRETLVRSGISISGRARDIDDLSFKPSYDDDSLTALASHVSPPLKDIVLVLNKNSQNLYAEQLLKTLGATLPVDDPELDPGSAEMGIARAMDTFAAAGVDTSRIQLADGSGLSRHNLVTARMTSQILLYMWNHPDDSTRAAFERSLPVGGVDGTLEYRFTTGAAKDNVRAKTGTVSNASSLSGYVLSARGTPIVFSIMCNHYTIPTSKIRRIQDRLVELLASYRK